MEVHVYAPGERPKKRKGKTYPNKKWIARFRYGGREYEITTDATNKRDTKKEAVEFVKSLDLECDSSADAVRVVLNDYLDGRRPSKNYHRYCEKIAGVIGHLNAYELTQRDFDHCCHKLYPGRTNETWNNQVFTPLIAALNWCDIPIRKIKRPRMKPIEDLEYDALTESDRDKILAAGGTPEMTAILCLWFLDGLRVSESLALRRRDHVDEPFADLAEKRIKTIQRKGGVTRAHWRAMHPKTYKALRKLTILPDDRYFPWRERWELREPIAEVIGRSGIRFTPHVGRHTFADIAHDKGASLRELMDLGGWRSPGAAIRYTHKKGVERQRARKKAL